jgi:hypothetical protein
MKCAILGTAPYHKNLAPFDDPEWEIWVCSPGNRRAFTRVTRWFELHGVDDCKGPENNDWNQDYFGWLNTQPFPVYMQEPNDLVPNCRVFPLRSWLHEFGVLGRIAATSSISLMIGLAAMERAERIAVFGVDMAADEEQYGGQKVGCLTMLELARQRGCKVEVPLSSCLATMPPLYGYAEATRMGRKLWVREEILKTELKAKQAEFDNLRVHIGNVEGELRAIRYVRRTFVDGEDAELDIEETVAEVGGRKAAIVTAKGTTITTGGAPLKTAMAGAPTRIPNGLGDPAGMEVEETAGGILVPRTANVEQRAEE